jgi:hypothetical protein
VRIQQAQREEHPRRHHKNKKNPSGKNVMLSDGNGLNFRL